MNYFSALTIMAALLFNSCMAPYKSFEDTTTPPPPDYSDEANWAALPFRGDAADFVPKQESWVSDSSKAVDVFYIHPTMYAKGKTWNADLDKKKLNKRVDKKPVKYQASVFNHVGRVYAPRYRQAVVKVFYKADDADSIKALNLAYQDVKAAFEYYLENYNNGRPIIIASHSQGTHHSRRLLADYFDGTPLHDQLVCAYTVGFAIGDHMYEELTICKNPKETGCFAGWMSFKAGYNPKFSYYRGNQSVNPISWTTDTTLAPKSESNGTVGLNMDKKREHSTNAQIVTTKDGKGEILWTNTGTPLLRLLRNRHVADYNLFWYDIRVNVKVRVGAFLNGKTSSTE